MELKLNKKYSFATDVSPVSVDLSSDVQRYYIDGTKTLAGSYVVNTTGTPVDGMQLLLEYDGTALTLSGNNVTVFGTVLTAAQAVEQLMVISTYVTSAWVTRVYMDVSQGKIVNIGDLADAIVDDDTIEIDGSNGLQLKALGITNAKVNAAAAIAYSKLTLTGAILNADLAGSIAWDKMVNLTANRALTSDASGDVVVDPAGVTDTELGYLNGVTSAIQTQLGTKLTTGTAALVNADVNAAAAIAYTKLNLTGTLLNADIAAAAAIAWSKMANLTASRALYSDGSGDVTASAVTDTELGYLSGVTSAVQTQIDALDSDVETYNTLTADTTLTAATLTKNIVLDTTAGNVQATLPATSTLTLGQKVEFNQIKANNGTIAANGADDIVDKDGTAGNATYPAVSMGTGGMIHIQYIAALTWQVILEI